jgi:oligosaccharyltransferase complex subunit gamma
MTAMMLLLAVVLLLLAPRSTVGKRGGAAKFSGGSTTPEARLVQIRELAASSKGHVLALDDSTYTHFATSKPRGYTLFVFLTAASPKYKCTICKLLEREFELLAESYVAGVKAAKGDENVFFIKLDYEHSSRVFQQYQVMSVPLIFHLSPYHGEREGETDFDIAQRDKLQISQQDIDAEFIANFVRDRSGVTVRIQRSMVGVYLTLVAVFAILALLVKPVIDSLPFLLSLVRMKWLWIVVSVGVYVCAISGLIFDIIRSPPWYRTTPKGEVMFFYPQSGNQFVVEGFIIGFLNLLCAGSLVFLAVAAPKFKSDSNRTSAVIGGMVVFIFSFFQIRALYVVKNRWYGSIH